MKGLTGDLASTYRPKKIGDVAGHELVKTLLAPRVAAAAPPQALLFSGPRGVGKTTMARILAMGLNCEQGPSMEPCGECRSCRAIEAGRGEFVREVNAGADGGVDLIRDLITELRTPVPASAWRVIVVDEGQGLTAAAQTAFLVPLEQPPARTVLVFCTTHPQGLSAPLRSRCEQVVFGTLAAAEVRARVEMVIAAEGLELKPATIEAIVSRADGCLRDALKLLQQAATNEAALEQVGGAEVERWAALTLRRVAEGDMPGALDAGQMLLRCAQTVSGEAAGALQALAEQLYNLHLVMQLQATAEMVRLGAEAYGSLVKAARATTPEKVEAWTDLIWEAWGRNKGALMRADALLGLTLVRMHAAKGHAVAVAPAPVVAQPQAVAPQVDAGGPLSLEGMIAAADPNVAGLLAKASLVSADGGELVLRCSSLATRKRIKTLAEQVLALAPGFQDLEVVA